MKRTLPTLLALLLWTTVAFGQGFPHGYPLYHPDGTITQLTPGEEAPKHSGAGTLSSGANWIPMAGGLNGYPRYATTMNGELYVLHGWTGPASDANDAISKWNGRAWEEVVRFHSCCALYSLAAYHGELYVGGYFDQIDDVPATRGIARWDGYAWHSVGGGVDGSPFSMKEYQGDLYVTGSFAHAGSAPGTSAIARWDGSAWHSVGGGLGDFDTFGNLTGGYGQALEVFRGKLYAGGIFSRAGGLPAKYLAAWDGTAWSGLPESPNREVIHMAVYNDELYIHGPYISTCGSVPTVTLARWNGQQWHPVGEHGWWGNVRCMTVFDGQLYAAGVGESNNAVERWNGQAWDLVGEFDASPYYVIDYNGALVTGGFFTSCGSTPLNHVARLCNDKDCGSISGTVYLDRDGECTWNWGDSALPHRRVMVTPGPYYVTTDATGSYRQYVPPGTYTVSLLPLLHWNQTCPTAGTYGLTVGSAGEQFPGRDFAMKPESYVRDLRISITGERARPGFPLDYYITYENVGTIPANGSISFTFDPRLQPTGSSQPPSSSSLGRFVWDFRDMPVDERRTIRVTMNVPVSMPVREHLCGYVDVDFDFGHELYFRHDDRDSTCVDVTNSCDPNDIAVSPLGFEGIGEIEPTDSVLDYTIRFQNTGTDTAFRIVVVDTLSPYHDPASVRLGASSHPYTFAMSGQGVLTWTFKDVMLPDSNASEPNSHGMLKYFVNLRPNLPAGTQITNRAAIYFDYNAAVVTNTVVSTISAALGIRHADGGGSIAFGPNPTSGVLRIGGTLREGGEIAVYNPVGKRVRTAAASAAPNQMLDLRDLPTGMYMIALPTAGGTIMRRVVIMR